MSRDAAGDKEPTILLAEPSGDAAELLLESLSNADIANLAYHAETASDTLDFLHQRGDCADANRPNLILLSADLPGDIDGIEVLEEVKESADLCAIPVVVMADDADGERVKQAYDNYANAYVKKPADPDEFLVTARTIREFWIDINRLPPEPDENEGNHSF